MPIDLTREEVFGLAEATRRLPRRSNRKRIHVSTLYRWSLTGCQGVKLETVRIGGQKFTSAGALQRFSEALSESEGSGVTETGQGRHCSREADVRRAEEALRAGATGEVDRSSAVALQRVEE